MCLLPVERKTYLTLFTRNIKYYILSFHFK